MALHNARRPPFGPYRPELLVKPRLLQLCTPSNKPCIPVRERLPSALTSNEKDFDPMSTKVFLKSSLFQRQFVDCLKEHVP